MTSNDGLQKHISELPDKDLVLMVTLDRGEYQEDALRMADAEVIKRNISKATIQNYLGSMNKSGREFEKKAGVHERMFEPGLDEEEELWEETNLPADLPKAFDPFIVPLTRRAPEPFFTKEAERRLIEKCCTLCAGPMKEIPHYCLVGRHWKKVVDAFPIRKTKLRYQACYVPICRACHSKCNNILKASAVFLWAGAVFALSVVLELGFKNRIFPYIGLAALLAIIIGLSGRMIARSFLINRKAVVATELYPNLGVPCKRTELFKAAKSEIKPLAKSNE